MIRKAIILSAGFGKRMRPLTEAIPKPLLPIGGIPVIRRTISELSTFGVKEIVINLHYKAELIKNEFKRNPPQNIKISFSEEKTILGTAGGIKAAAYMLGQQNIVIINSDIVADIDLESAARFHEEKNAICTMVLRKDVNADKYGAVEIDDAHKVRRFLGLPQLNNTPLSKYMFTGVQIVTPQFLDKIPPNKYCDLSTEVYPGFVADGAGIYGYVTQGNWIDIGKPDRYLHANFHQLEKDKPLVFQTNNLEQKIKAPVHLGENVSVKEGVSLGPYCCIGKECKIDNNVEISESVIMDGVSIEEGASVKVSIIGPGVTIPAGEHIDRMMIVQLNGKNCSVRL